MKAYYFGYPGSGILDKLEFFKLNYLYFDKFITFDPILVEKVYRDLYDDEEHTKRVEEIESYVKTLEPLIKSGILEFTDWREWDYLYNPLYDLGVEMDKNDLEFRRLALETEMAKYWREKRYFEKQLEVIKKNPQIYKSLLEDYRIKDISQYTFEEFVVHSLSGRINHGMTGAINFGGLPLTDSPDQIRLINQKVKRAFNARFLEDMNELGLLLDEQFEIITEMLRKGYSVEILLQELNIKLPYITQIPVERLIDLKKSEYHLFKKFQSKVEKTIENFPLCSLNEIREYLKDRAYEIRNEVMQIDEVMRVLSEDHKKYWIKKSVETGVEIVATLALQIVSGFPSLPIIIAGASLSAAKTAVEYVLDYIPKKEKILKAIEENSSSYILWKITKSSK